jgi:hypothetical protein
MGNIMQHPGLCRSFAECDEYEAMLFGKNIRENFFMKKFWREMFRIFLENDGG